MFSVDLSVLDPMAIILAIFVLALLYALWRAHQNRTSKFDAFDLIMEDGVASKTGVAFMLVLIVSTWIVADLQLKGQLKENEGLFIGWLTAWVSPLVARVVFGKKEPPASVSEETTTTRTVTPAAPVQP